MEILVLFFGPLTDITGTSEMRLADVTDTDELMGLLKKKFPLLDQVKYMIAVDRRIVREKTKLSDDAEVAMLPPFSGG